MPDSQPQHSRLSPTAIERPLCEKCGDRMMLARIMPGPKGFEQRNFECNRCDHVFTQTLAIDPMNSDVTGWLNGELGGSTDQ
jgi:hypothetical protein